MSSELNLKLCNTGETVDLRSIRGGIKKEDVNESQQLIFDKIDKNSDGLLTDEEVKAFLTDVYTASGDQKLGKREADKLLKQLGIYDKKTMNSDTLYAFINNLSSHTDTNKIKECKLEGDNIVIDYNDGKTEYYSKEGHKTKEVETGTYITQTTEFNNEGKKTKVIQQMNEDSDSMQTTEFLEDGGINTTYSGEYINDNIIKKEQSADLKKTTYTYADGTTKKEELSEDGKTKTVTITDAEGKVSSTETYTFQDGTWVKQEPEPEEKPEEETEQNAALEALKDGFDKGNTISVTIQGGQTKLSSGDYQGTINLARGETFEEGKMPQTLFMTLPQGSTGKMKLTYDESTGLYTTTRGDRQFRITADNGKITMEAVTDNQEVQKKLNRNIDEWQQIKRNAINTAARETEDKKRNESVTPIYDSAKSTFDGQALNLDSEKIPDFSTSSLEYSTLIGQLPTQPNMSLANKSEYSYLIGGTLNYDNNGYVKSIKLDNKQELYIYRDEENKPNCLSYRNPNNNEQVFYIDPKTYSPAYYLNYSNDSTDFSRYSMVNNMLVNTYKNGTYKYLIYDENRNLVGYQVISGNETSYYKSDGTKVDTKEDLSDKVYFANEL